MWAEIVSFFFRNRIWIRRVASFAVILLLFALNAYGTELQTLAGLWAPFVYALILVLTEFGPELFSLINSRFGDSKRLDFIFNTFQGYRSFLRDRFGYEITSTFAPDTDLPVLFQLDNKVENCPEDLFGTRASFDRRSKIVGLIYLIRSYKEIGLSAFEDIYSIVRTRFSDQLTDTGKKEFIKAYYHLVLQDHFFENKASFFTELPDEDYERTRLSFYDRYLKDDYIKEITERLNFSEETQKSFKASLQVVAESPEFNLKFLQRYVDNRRRFRKIFLVTGSSNFPKPIQMYIKQNPYFILNYTSIANLPIIEKSRGLNVYLFSPYKFVSSAGELFEIFKKLAPSITKHPLKIYEIDPSTSQESGLMEPSDFRQAIRYFEQLTFDTTEMAGDLSYQQVLSLLEKNQVSLRELFGGMPIGEMSNSAKQEEKQYLTNIFRGFVSPRKARSSIFNILGKEDQIYRHISGLRLSQVTIEYPPAELQALFGGRLLVSGARQRLLKLAQEICQNVQALNLALPVDQ